MASSFFVLFVQSELVAQSTVRQAAPPVNVQPFPPANPPAPASLGNIQPFDSYSTGRIPRVQPLPQYPTQPAPFSQQPQALFPQNPQAFQQPSQWPPAVQPTQQGWGPGNILSQPQQGPYLKFFQNFRFRHTYLGGDNGREVATNDTEIAGTLAFPNFMFSTKPLYVSPGFIFHQWDGPAPPGVAGTVDLPARAYSGYVDAAFNPQPFQNMPQLTAELGVRIGIYSDFNSLNSDSLRLQGRGFGVVQMTPTLKAKLGVIYIDRNDLKMLPAGGLIWEPNEHTRLDLLFPNPKYSKYLWTVGNAEVWWYLGAEYGGGSWTIERGPARGFASDRIDMNDIRAIGGIEWNTTNQFKGFIEAGYVFDREVIYVSFPGDRFSPKDTFMVRAGFNY